ncbi:hypothetical protein [Cupriavidus taiwanensis]|uniref:hypothetical protein n=1 Tax=Cupriavidus taiwanensis TaxID=164546 RepID=UPI000427E37C|nr:hypothetical protein [Cupriavidus taiwanensis]SOZ12052.1 conserved protein of unknown function [Cupriavidus taiwanensis]
MNAGTLTLSTFDHCRYQIGRTDAPELKARGVIQTTVQAEPAAVLLDLTLTGTRRHQRVMATVLLLPADLDGLIGQLVAVREMLHRQQGGKHDA